MVKTFSINLYYYDFVGLWDFFLIDYAIFVFNWKSDKKFTYS